MYMDKFFGSSEISEINEIHLQFHSINILHKYALRMVSYFTGHIQPSVLLLPGNF